VVTPQAQAGRDPTRRRAKRPDFPAAHGTSGLPARYLRLFKEHLGEPAVFLDARKVGVLESAGAGDGEDDANRAAMGMGQAIYEAWSRG
jgi:hypothetical protein